MQAPAVARSRADARACVHRRWHRRNWHPGDAIRRPRALTRTRPCTLARGLCGYELVVAALPFNKGGWTLRMLGRARSESIQLENAGELRTKGPVPGPAASGGRPHASSESGLDPHTPGTASTSGGEDLGVQACEAPSRVPAGFQTLKPRGSSAVGPPGVTCQSGQPLTLLPVART
jgi:hypothetical protein